uniref:Uncharacterized protein n=1 Tax=Anguilla anguilla TaxID=7936 RepID=A0A0E9SLB6_ANGAN
MYTSTHLHIQQRACLCSYTQKY